MSIIRNDFTRLSGICHRAEFENGNRENELRIPSHVSIRGICTCILQDFTAFGSEMDIIPTGRLPPPSPFWLLSRRSGRIPALPYPPPQVFSEWSTSTPPVNAFAVIGTNPLNFVSHSKGSLHFISFHLLHLTGGVVGFRAGQFQHLAVYQNVVAAFAVWPITLFYIVAMGALSLHLSHGIWSVLQTLGWSNARNKSMFKVLSRVIGVVVFVGFTSVTAAVIAGWLH